MRPRWLRLVLEDGDYNPRVRALANGRSGAYAIRERESHRVMYVGESSCGKLWKTMLRHFQAPDSFATVRETGVFRRGPTFYEVAIWPTSTGNRRCTRQGEGKNEKGDQRALNAQARWIATLKPEKNRDDGKAFDADAWRAERARAAADADPWGGMFNPSRDRRTGRYDEGLDRICARCGHRKGEHEAEPPYAQDDASYSGFTCEGFRAMRAKKNPTPPAAKFDDDFRFLVRDLQGRGDAPIVRSRGSTEDIYVDGRPEIVSVLKRGPDGKPVALAEWIAHAIVHGLEAGPATAARVLGRPPVGRRWGYSSLPGSMAAEIYAIVDDGRGGQNLFTVATAQRRLAAQTVSQLANAAIDDDDAKRAVASVPRAARAATKGPRAGTYAWHQARLLDELEARGWAVSRSLKVPQAKKERVTLFFKPQAIWWNEGGGSVNHARSLHADVKTETAEGLELATGISGIEKRARREREAYEAEKALVEEHQAQQRFKQETETRAFRGKAAAQFARPAPAKKPAGYGEEVASGKKAGQLKLFNPRGPLTNMGALTALQGRDLRTGRVRVLRWPVSKAPTLAYDEAGRLFVVYGGTVARPTSAKETAEYRRTHWGRKGRGVVTSGGVSVPPFRKFLVSESITYTTEKGTDSGPVDYVHAWGEGARGKWLPPIVVEHECHPETCRRGSKCAAKGSIALMGGTYHVDDRGIVG